ncbi:SGNH/GDSL hydrolase family protein [Flectobacillus major]|uniref:SGNH/GDSL hydrolase family protein n=1 Tax=Flectobacillus major TaxID=103 RepID=UPI000407971D|nr:SGNH/GDSL hydrolase family protein [Flectobacillus major]
MRILVIGGCHVFGYGIQNSQGFVEVFSESMKILENEPIQIDSYVHFSMEKTVELLMSIGNKISKYDLVLMQIGHEELMAEDSIIDLVNTQDIYFKNSYRADTNHDPVAPSNTQLLKELYDEATEYIDEANIWEYCLTSLKLKCLKSIHKIGKLGRLAYYQRYHKIILSLLTPVKEQTILISPMPSLNPCNNYMRQEGRKIFEDECTKQQFKWLQSIDFIEKHPYFFLSDGNHLNALGHRVLASQLLRFYRHEVRKHQFYFHLCSN